MQAKLANAVRRRAGGRCEYCRMPQSAYPTTTFPIDHIVPRQHAGPTRLSNLALSCLHCNSHKGPNLAGLDPLTRKLTKLFHPRRHSWRRHYRWDGAWLIGRTAIGRATIAVLALNLPELVQVREAILEESAPFD